MVSDLYGDLDRHVGTAEGLVGWQPAGRVGVALLLVGRPRYGEQFEWVVGHIGADGQAQLLRSGLPGVTEGYDMVDLNGCARPPAPDEGDDCVRVGVVQQPARHGAAVGAELDDYVGKVSAQDVVSGITAIVAIGHRGIVGPSRAELGTAVAGKGRPSLDWKGGRPESAVLVAGDVWVVVDVVVRAGNVLVEATAGATEVVTELSIVVGTEETDGVAFPVAWRLWSPPPPAAALMVIKRMNARTTQERICAHIGQRRKRRHGFGALGEPCELLIVGFGAVSGACHFPSEVCHQPSP